MRHRRLRERLHGTPELEVTAFMNLMVVLIPFLLMSVVFTKMAILELNLPGLGDASQDKEKPEFQLQIIIHQEHIVLSDSKGGRIATIPADKDGYAYAQLTDVLKQIKARFPDKNNATILAERNTSYDTLVKVMDATRNFRVVRDNKLLAAELFPDISIGDAPAK